VLAKYPASWPASRAGRQGFPVLVKDASLGGEFPVMCVTLMNPRTGGVFASFGAHPSLEVALERSLTELLQGRSFEGLNDCRRRPSRASRHRAEQLRRALHRFQRRGVVALLQRQGRLRIRRVGFLRPRRKLQRRRSRDAVRHSRRHGQGVYMAVYDQLGATACRILVPGYSEIYPVEDLIWDNTNKALLFRADILNLHRLDDEACRPCSSAWKTASWTITPTSPP
jgi:ribosomal protein S12 methylthiotransferase accessory factor